MIQTDLPIPQPDTVAVPLPDAFERWRDIYLHDAGQKLLVFLVLCVLLYLLTRFSRRLIRENIEDVNRRHIVGKWVTYISASLLVLVAVALFSESLAGLGTVLALLLAGVAVALQDVLKSVVGWLYVSSRSGVEVGSRIEVQGTVGDVIDIGVLKTTVLEVGNRVYGPQSTGRLVTIPNYRLLSEAVLMSGADNPFTWQEVRVTVTYESDWRRAESILRSVGEELHEEVAPQLEAGFHRLERRFAVKHGTLTPIVYVSLGDSGVELALRFLTPIRRQRGSLDRVSRRILEAFTHEPMVELAYPTHRLFRLGEKAPGRLGAADMHDERSDLGRRTAPLPAHESGEEGLPPPDMMTE